ncbi:unnamed protein product [Zymoseptoria tritici ST99CH_1A5]|uniref:Uncharacterized protein n=1 Tax=Zymoseptoria tritici ST99CH_1A5 TaxID=1276529 RepID=A0A1Y6L5E5_ZYMTR|nr:unnamed protein product [Zymoseptoria tritici ST99CH_1A5]
MVVMKGINSGRQDGWIVFPSSSFHHCKNPFLPSIPTHPSQRSALEHRSSTTTLNSVFPALSRSEAICKSQTSVHNPVVAPIRLIPPTFSFPKRQSTQKQTLRDWKWGNFRQHCQKEYRTGETCGMKMIYNTMLLAEKCPSCEKIEKKLRRRDKAMSDWKRWSQQGGKFKASMEKAVEDVKTLEREIEALQREKERRYAAVGNARRN